MYRRQLPQYSGNPCSRITSGPSMGPAWTTCRLTPFVLTCSCSQRAVMCCLASICDLPGLFPMYFELLLFDLFAQLEQPFDKGFRARRTPRNIDIHRHDGIDARYGVIGVVELAA